MQNKIPCYAQIAEAYTTTDTMKNFFYKEKCIRIIHRNLPISSTACYNMYHLQVQGENAESESEILSAGNATRKLSSYASNDNVLISFEINAFQ